MNAPQTYPPAPPTQAPVFGPAEGSDPLRQFRILYRSRWQILRTTVLVFVLALLAVFAVTPSYRGTSTLLIEPMGAKVVEIDEVYNSGVPGVNLSEVQNTQIEVLQSRTIAERVFDRLKLGETEEYRVELADEDGDILSDVMELLGLGSDADGGRDAAIELLVENLTVNPVARSNVVRVNAESEDPELAAKIANTVAEIYIEYDREARGGIADEASGWLGERLVEVKKDLEASEKALQAFYESEQLVNVGGARGMVEDEITDNARRLREARTTRSDLENVYRRIVSARTNAEVLQEIPQIAQEPLVQTTKRLFLEAQNEVGSLSSRYGAKHPKMITGQARLADARNALRTQVLLAADGIRSQYELARNTETSMAGIVQDSRTQIQGLDRKENQLQILQREVDSNRKLYDTFLQRSKETDVAGGLHIGTVRLIERAVVPKDPNKPKKVLWLAAALLSGAFLGLALALIGGFLDNTLKTPLDLEQATQIPVLTVLPKVKDTQDLPHLELNEPQAMFSEGIRTLRTSLLLADVNRKRRRILVTSAVPGEGKTSVALNLAMAIGQVERVLLIDADLRKPTVGARLGLAADANGLVDLITGTAPAEACIHRHAAGSIDVLPCGKPPPNPLELISSERFSQLIESVGANYDRIVIDSPPCHPVSDSHLLCRLVDAVFFLVKADSTPVQLVTNAVKALRQAGAPLVGAVLNEADTQKQAGFAYGYYYYQGGYGSYKATS